MPGGDLKINGRGPKLDARLATSWLRAAGRIGDLWQGCLGRISDKVEQNRLDWTGGSGSRRVKGWKFGRAVKDGGDVNPGSIFRFLAEGRFGGTGRPGTWLERKEPEKEVPPPFRRPPGGDGPPWSLPWRGSGRSGGPARK